MRLSPFPRLPLRRLGVLPPLLLALAVSVAGCQTTDLPDADSAAKPVPPAKTAGAGDAGRPAPPPAAAAPVEPGMPLPAAARAVESRQVVRAALLVPMSGPAAAAGKAMFNAAQLALFELAGANFELVPLDTKGTPDGAALAAREAVALEADILLGPLFSASVKAAAPVARSAGLPVIGFTTDRTAAGEGIFVMGFLPEPQIERVVGHARRQGLERFALLAPDNAYGRAVAKILSRLQVQDPEMELVEARFYEASGTDASEQVKLIARYEERQKALADYRRLVERHAAQVIPPEMIESGKTPKELAGEIPEIADIQDELAWLDTLDTLGPVPLDAIVLPDEGGRLRNVAALLPFYDVDTRKVRLLGTMLWDDPTLAQEPALVGGWYPARPGQAYEGFAAAYSAAFGEAPPSVASLAYDATALAAVLARHPDLDLSAQSLVSPSGFAGVDGIFRFRTDGTVERGLAVMEIGKAGPRVVDPAPTSFEEVDRLRRERPGAEDDARTVPAM